MTELVLASASPARYATLRSAGIDPHVRVSHVDEGRVLEAAEVNAGGLDPADAVLVLAKAKAEDVATRLGGDDPAEGADEVGSDALVLGCDSMLEFDGETLGKPWNEVDARARWVAMRGKSGVLHTGHWLIDLRDSESGGTGGTLGAASATTVHFADISDAELDAYVASGEPLVVAGAFTIDGLGGPFIRGIEGDHHGVVGLSLPLLRELLGDVGIAITSLWNMPDAVL